MVALAKTKKNFKSYHSLKNYYSTITCHIDILQKRSMLIHILDYKPNGK